MKPITVKDAKYLEEFKIEIIFSDNKKQVVDFKTFLNSHSHPQYNKYKKAENFKIENGNVIWGKNWDMIFPVYDLYRGKLQ